MKIWQLVIVTYVIFVAQTSVVSLLEIGESRPQLIVMGLLVLIPTLTARWVIPFAAAWGLISDALAPSGLGIDLVGFSTLAFALWHLQRGGIYQTAIGRCVLLFPSALVLVCGSNLLRELTADSNTTISAVVHESFKTATYTTALGSAFILLAAVRSARTGSSLLIPDVRNRWKMLTQ